MADVSSSHRAAQIYFDLSDGIDAQLMALQNSLFFFAIWGVLLALADYIARKSPFFQARLSESLSGEIVPLTSLRGLLAFGVFFSHSVVNGHFWKTGKWVPPASYFFAQLSTVSVLLFFFLSGFLFWSKLISASHSNEGAFDWRVFFLGRFWRIVPVYFVSISLVFLLVALRARGQWHESPVVVMKEAFRWLTFGLPDGFLPSLNSDAHSSRMNAFVTWTLRYEWLFLFSLPGLLWFAVRHRIFLLMGLLLAAYFFLRRVVFAGEIAQGLRPWYQHTALGFLTYLGTGFGCGMFTAYLLSLWEKKLRWLARPWVGAMVLGSATLLLVQKLPGAPLGLPVQRGLLMAVFLPLAAGNSIFGLLNRPSVRLLGLISYSTYLFHGLTLYIMSAALTHVYPLTDIPFSLIPVAS